MIDVTEIEKRVDRVVTAAIPMNVSMGGIELAQYVHMMELAKTMATCRAGIPQWLRASVGDCLMIWQRAARWGLDPYFVAEKSYLMEGKGGTKVGYESQLIHAVIESLAPLKGRLRYEIIGEGDERRCKVWGTFKGEIKPHEYISETLGKRLKDIGTNDRGNFRGSPNWLQKPEVQLFYDASRDWARINCPDVLAGVYTRDELPDMEPVDVTPQVVGLAQKLKDAKASHATARGFSAGAVATAAGSIIEGEANPGQQEADDEATQGRGSSSAVEGRSDSDGGASAATDNPGGSPVGDRRDEGGDEKPPGDDAASAQAEIFPPDSKPAPKGKGKRK